MKPMHEQVSDSGKTERPDTIVYRTESGEVSWGKGVKVWVEIEKDPDDTFTVRSVIEDSQKVLEDEMDILPTTIKNVADAKEAKKLADKLFEDRDKWAGQ